MRGRRIELDGTVVERNGQQFVSGRGLFGDGFTEIHRVEPHGFASSPPKGSKGIVLFANDDADQAYVFGCEHPGHRPSDLPAGASAIYDSAGNIIKLVGDGIVVDAASRTIDITAGSWTLHGNAVIDGNLHVTGNVTCAGTVTDSDGNNGA